ncbi:hypothetical protein [Bythopirellula goksoeyrii]|uniref:Uncharacterized protein n=1 Tax=Bythopirellula goksoeyrii TaxID=1400387 RepID=A0A5B9QF10_9BACT|nr:hypothetical protein [Bythopirellula goksoeyrii]QEG36102.1 hypothetical protein Pr1d_34110 [Bythopirellula goksoeyrii]
MMIGNGSIESGIASVDVSRVADSMAVRHYDFRHKFKHKCCEGIAANRLISFGAVKRRFLKHKAEPHLEAANSPS